MKNLFITKGNGGGQLVPLHFRNCYFYFFIPSTRPYRFLEEDLPSSLQPQIHQYKEKTIAVLSLFPTPCFLFRQEV